MPGRAERRTGAPQVGVQNRPASGRTSTNGRTLSSRHCCRKSHSGRAAASTAVAASGGDEGVEINIKRWGSADEGRGANEEVRKNDPQERDREKRSRERGRKREKADMRRSRVDQMASSEVRLIGKRTGIKGSFDTIT